MKDSHCPECGRAYGVRRRCYYCHGKPRKRVLRRCAVCRKRFEVQENVAKDVARRQGTYCSRACKHQGQGKRIERPLGRKYINRQGYVMVRVSRDRSGGAYRAQHRIVMERKLGRELQSDEQVHHINGNKQDNRLRNLQLLTNSEHQKLHARERC